MWVSDAAVWLTGVYFHVPGPSVRNRSTDGSSTTTTSLSTSPCPPPIPVSRKITCTVCRKTVSRSKLEYHITSHMEKKANKCILCGKGYCAEQNSPKGAKKNTKYTPFECMYCGEKFTDCWFWKRHVNGHEKKMDGLPKHQCEYCDRGFKSEEWKRLHTEKVHPVRFSCTLCNDSFISDELLKNHMQTDHKHVEKHWQCSYCGFRSKLKSTVLKHERIHSGEKHFKCSYCEKSFVNSTSLKIHEKIHSRSDSHQCECCGKLSMEEV